MTYAAKKGMQNITACIARVKCQYIDCPPRASVTTGVIMLLQRNVGVYLVDEMVATHLYNFVQLVELDLTIAAENKRPRESSQ